MGDKLSKVPAQNYAEDRIWNSLANNFDFGDKTSRILLITADYYDPIAKFGVPVGITSGMLVLNQ